MVLELVEAVSICSTAEQEHETSAGWQTAEQEHKIRQNIVQNKVKHGRMDLGF